MLCAQNVLDRVRRKFGVEGDVHVRAELLKQEKEAQVVETSGDGKEADEAEKKDEGVEAWLVPWDEMPEGCVVLLGKVEEDWQKWGTVRSAYMAFSRSKLNGRISSHTSPRKGKTKGVTQRAEL